MIKETFDCGESFLGLAFDHVTGKSPRGTGKTQNGNFRTDRFNDPPDGLGQECRFCLGVEYFEPVDVPLAAHRTWHVWPGVAEFKLQAHRFGVSRNDPNN